MEKIYLIGFMGCGKTTIAKGLSELLNVPCLDLDQAIEAAEEMPIAKMFELYGEGYFRAKEYTALVDSEALDCGVIATGGGIIGKAENRTFLKQHTTIYLKWEFDTLYERIKQDTTRPMVKTKEQLQHLFESRSAYYEACSNILIDCNGKDIAQVVASCRAKIGGKDENNSSCKWTESEFFRD